MCVQLKIKNKHLAVESRIIRFQELKISNARRKMRLSPKHDAAVLQSMQNQLESLASHRMFDVRNENRATGLARAYIAGKQYKRIEQNRKPTNESNFQCYVVPRVVEMLKKYHSRTTTREDVMRWIEKA